MGSPQLTKRENKNFKTQLQLHDDAGMVDVVVVVVVDAVDVVVVVVVNLSAAVVVVVEVVALNVCQVELDPQKIDQTFFREIVSNFSQYYYFIK